MQRGIALIEVIVFMVVIAIAACAMLNVFGKTNLGSAELLASRQALAIAEAMLNEVTAAPFTVCDPQDARFLLPPPCATMTETVIGGGPEANELRPRLPPPARSFDNVNDYHNFAMGPGITDSAGQLVAGAESYSLTVSVAPVVAPPANWNGIPGGEMLVVTVSVTSPLLRGPVVLEGMRSRYAPRTAPL